MVSIDPPAKEPAPSELPPLTVRLLLAFQGHVNFPSEGRAQNYNRVLGADGLPFRITLPHIWYFNWSLTPPPPHPTKCLRGFSGHAPFEKVGEDWKALIGGEQTEEEAGKQAGVKQAPGPGFG